MVNNNKKIENSDTIDPEFEQFSVTLQERIGYSFKDVRLLKTALIHKSHSNEKRQQKHSCEDQDALGTLGDAVLKTILCDWLIRKGYDTKGQITIKKSEIENREFLAQLGKKFELMKYIQVGKGAEEQKHNEQPNVIAETLEAVIGAIYIDSGFDRAKEVVLTWYGP